MLLEGLTALLTLAAVALSVVWLIIKRRSAPVRSADWIPGDEDFEDTLAERFRSWMKAQPRLKFDVDQLGFNPRTAPSVAHFRPVVLNTHCLFARSSKLCGAKQWDPALSLEDNVRASLPAFAAFLKVALTQHYDGFVYEIVGREYSATVEEFGESVRRLLSVISDADPSRGNCMRKSYINKRGWCFEYDRDTIFITTFAPCFPSDHSRYGFGCDSAFVLFQPEYSFAWHNIGSDTPHTNWKDPKTVRDKIRVEFFSNNRPYEIPDTVHYPPALHLVRPLKVTDPPIEWWRPKAEKEKEKQQKEEQETRRQQEAATEGKKV